MAVEASPIVEISSSPWKMLSLSVLGKETIWMVGDGDTPGSPIATQKSWGERDVDWSPDGRSIAFPKASDIVAILAIPF